MVFLTFLDNSVFSLSTYTWACWSGGHVLKPLFSSMLEKKNSWKDFGRNFKCLNGVIYKIFTGISQTRTLMILLLLLILYDFDM